MAKPITVVCGFPRSGTSLTMRMLHAGGMRVHVESESSYEHSDTQQLPGKWSFLLSCRGKAVKILDPQIFTPPESLSYRFIWLDRDVSEQAKSQFKFMAAVGMHFPKNDHAIRAIADSLSRDRAIVLEILSKYPKHDRMTLQFEEILADPDEAARRLSDFTGIDANKASRVVIPRCPECLPVMLEELIMAEYKS